MLKNRWMISQVSLLILLGLAACNTLDTDQEFLPPPGAMEGKTSDAASQRQEYYKFLGDAVYKLGRPYKVNGVWYFPSENWKYDEIGYGGVYASDIDNQRTANGEIYSKDLLTGAHKTLPLPSVVRVTNLANNKTAVIRVNDRGPFSNDHIMDVSAKAAEILEFGDAPPARIRVEILPEESKNAAELLLKTEEARLLKIPSNDKEDPKEKTSEASAASSEKKEVENPDFSVTVVPAAADKKEEAPQDQDSAGTSSNADSEKTIESESSSKESAVSDNESDAASTDVETTTEQTSPQENLAEAADEGQAPVTSSIAETPVSQTEEVQEKVSEDQPFGGEERDEPKIAAQTLESGYYVQAGIFGVPANARRLSEKLSSLGNTVVTPLKLKDRSLDKVLVGPFSNKALAREALAKIKETGLKDARLSKI